MIPRVTGRILYRVVFADSLQLSSRLSESSAMLSLRALAARRAAVPLLRRYFSPATEVIAGASSAPPPLPFAKEKTATTTSAAPASTSSSTSAPQDAETPTEPPTEDTVKKTRGRRRPFVTRRPNISLDKPREWNRPVKQGVLPAYDEALKLIEADSARLKRERAEILARIEELEKVVEKDDAVLAELQDLRQKADVLEIQSEINLPAVRWNAFNGMGMSI